MRVANTLRSSLVAAALAVARRRSRTRWCANKFLDARLLARRGISTHSRRRS
jgi:hypothetical protein